jgi:hypothetical protein
MIASPPIAVVYMGFYYVESMIHATYIWAIIIARMGVFIGCRYGSEMGIAVSILVNKQMQNVTFLSLPWHIQ